MSGSRRSHTKSRNGCAQCKARRVRCNCIAPICSNCCRRRERCSFLDAEGSPTITSSSSATVSKLVRLQARAGPLCPTTRPATVDIDPKLVLPPPSPYCGYLLSIPALATTAYDGELLRHFATYTGLTLVIASTTVLRTMWLQVVPKLLTEHTFLHHMLLSISALHICSLRVPNPRPYFHLACFHFQRSSMLFRENVKTIGEDNWLPTLLFSAAVPVFHFYVPFAAQEWRITWPGMLGGTASRRLSSSLRTTSTRNTRSCGSTVTTGSSPGSVTSPPHNMLNPESSSPASSPASSSSASSPPHGPYPPKKDPQSPHSPEFNVLEALSILRSVNPVLEIIAPFLKRGRQRQGNDPSLPFGVNIAASGHDQLRRFAAQVQAQPASSFTAATKANMAAGAGIETSAGTYAASGPGGGVGAHRNHPILPNQEMPFWSPAFPYSSITPIQTPTGATKETLPATSTPPQIPPSLLSDIRSLQVQINSSPSLRPSSRSALVAALSQLQTWIRKTKGRPFTWRHLQVWLSLIPREFLELLESGSPEATAIFHVWCKVMVESPHSRTWYLGPWLRKALQETGGDGCRQRETRKTAEGGAAGGFEWTGELVARGSGLSKRV